MLILFACAISISTACACSVFLSGHKSTIFNQPAGVLSLGYFLTNMK